MLSTGATLAMWERGEGASPQLALHTNVANGRAFADPASPAFEVLPHLARAVLAILAAGCAEGAGVRVGTLPAVADLLAGSGEGEARADLHELLELLVEHRVLEHRHPKPLVAVSYRLTS